jgi:hypothetical protein
VINDAGAIAVNYALATEAAVVRLNADGSLVVLARADQLGSAPYLDFAPAVSMNAAGQVVVRATNPDSTSSVVLLDDGGAVEIARSATALLNLSPPTINDSGVVAFTAQVPPSGDVHVYSSSGGALTDEGTTGPCAGPSSQAPVINNDGLVLSDCGGLPLFTARGGGVSVVLAGNEDAIFSRLASGYGLSNRGRPVFVTGPAASTEVGLFTGNDPLSHRVVRTGDVVFGLGVGNVVVGPRSINDAGQIALLLQVEGDTPASHVVLATPPRMAQTIAFAELGTRTFGAAPFAVTATASSGLAVALAAGGACSIVDGTVTLRGGGACTITASQGGDLTYLPAPDVSQMLTILRAPQTITVGPLPEPTFGAPPSRCRRPRPPAFRWPSQPGAPAPSPTTS